MKYIKGKCIYIANFLNSITVEINEMNTTEPNEYEINSDLVESLEVQTIHSQEENKCDGEGMLKVVVNRFKTQTVVIEEKESNVKKVFGNKRIFIDKTNIKQGNISNIFRRKI